MTEQAQEETTFEETTVGEGTTMEDQMNQEAAEAVDTAATAAEAPAAAGGAPADLTVQDLQALKVIIDVASQRGAFRPNEMQTVGATYTKLEQFLGAIAASQQAQQAAEAAAPAAEG
jgi:hypothetical protein